MADRSDDVNHSGEQRNGNSLVAHSPANWPGLTSVSLVVKSPKAQIELLESSIQQSSPSCARLSSAETATAKACSPRPSHSLQPDSDGDVLTCRPCGYKIVWKNAVAGQILMCERAKSLLCQFCKQPFFNADDYWCPKCEYVTKDLTSIYLHYKMHYYVSCTACGEIFGSITLLREHKQFYNNMTKYLIPVTKQRVASDCHCAVDCHNAREQLFTQTDPSYRNMIKNARGIFSDRMRELRIIKDFLQAVYTRRTE